MSYFVTVVFTSAMPVIIIVFIVMFGRVKKAQAEAIGKQSFEKLVNEIMENNAYLKIKLAVLEEKLASIDKMLKEVE